LLKKMQERVVMPMSMESPRVVLMLKAPRPGRVKTRLATDLGVDGATAAYRCLVEHQLGQLPKDWRVTVAFDPPEAWEEMRVWLGSTLEFLPQVSGDLGDRLNGVMSWHFATDSRPLIFLGGDCPYLLSEMLQESADHLREQDTVLIPALDGGYCLIGMRIPAPECWRKISWSTDQVLQETVARLTETGRSFRLMEPLEDVDDLGSWQRAQSVLANAKW
jgi:rSAM/selenodomain-associated transferase 1